MAAIKVADIFAQLGARVDLRGLNQFQKRLDHVKRQLLSIKKVMREVGATRVQPITNLASVRSLNAELNRTRSLIRGINSQGPVRVRSSGGGAGGSGGASRRSGGGGRSQATGIAAGFGLARNNAFTRQFAGGFAAATATRAIFRATSDVAAIETALRATLAPGQELEDVLGFLNFEANRLGFEFRTSALEFAKLAAAGNAAGLATEDIQNIFLGAQEASRVFNLSVADTEGVLKAFTQIISKGKVTAEELRNQLGDRLPAAVPIFAQALGVTTEELSKMLERGEILANDALPKFATRLRETFGPEVDAASQNLTGFLNRFRNELLFLGAEIGRSGIEDFFKIALGFATQLIRILIPGFKVLAGVVRIAVVPFEALTRVAKALSPLVNKFLPEGLQMTASAALLLAPALLLVNRRIATMALNFLRVFFPIFLVLGLIDEIITMLQGGDTVFGRFVDKLDGMSESSSALVSSIGALFDLFSTGVEKIAEMVAHFGMLEDKMKAVADVFKTLPGFFTDVTLRAVGLDDVADDILTGSNSRNTSMQSRRMTNNFSIVAAPGMDPLAVARQVEATLARAEESQARELDGAFTGRER